MSVRYMIAAFDETVTRLLLPPLLESIMHAYHDRPAMSIVLCEAGLRESIADIIQAYPFAAFGKFKTTTENMIGRKAQMWNELMRLFSGEQNVLMDMDMILVKPVDSYFTKSFDIGFTYKTHKDEGMKWPINTGLMLARKNEDVLSFFNKWCKDTNDALDNGLRKTPLIGGIWGAADQAALGNYLDVRTGYDLPILRDGVSFKGFPCDELNETRCVHVDPKLHVLHYKSKWHKILMDGEFRESRSEEACRGQYEIWKSFEKKANERMSNQ